MLNSIQEDLITVYEQEKTKNPTIICILEKQKSWIDKIKTNSINYLTEKQRKKLNKFLNKYKPNEIILTKCKESFQIEDLYFKRDNYYLLMFLGIITTFEEVPFIIHDISFLGVGGNGGISQARNDSFRTQTNYREIPYLIQDEKILEDSNKGTIAQIRHDPFRIRTKHLFSKVEFICTIGKNESKEDDDYQYIYFNNNVIFNQDEIIDIIKNQKSIYEPSYSGDCG